MIKEIIVGVVTALTISIIYYLWNTLENVSINIPKNAVIGFVDDKCPIVGWEEYKPAYGQFIRGIDKSGKSIDPDGQRYAGNPQSDAIKNHSHTMGVNSTDTTAMTPLGLERLAHFTGDTYGKGSKKRTDNQDLGETETRPKNITLLFCRKL